jgi:hypothetical protein
MGAKRKEETVNGEMVGDGLRVTRLTVQFTDI